MKGAIIGDIIGSRFEFNNHRSTRFKLFTNNCSFTDDTICTIATADWLMSEVHTPEAYAQTLQRWCRTYPHPMGGYGNSFYHWVNSNYPEPYNSFGNGSAMRVSPVAWYAKKDLNQCVKLSMMSAGVSHNHLHGINGANAVSAIIWFVLNGKEKDFAINVVSKRYEYDTTRSCAYLRKFNTFDETCQGTLPAVLSVLRESTDFESAIRLAVSIGGDTDTIAAIVGSMAEACYGVPGELWEEAKRYLPEDMLIVVNKFERYYE